MVNKTSQAFIWSHFLKAPFWGMYALLLFILSKDMGATPLQITALLALKPAVSLLSPYWSALVHKRPDRLRSNVILASIIGHAPFFLFPWIQSPWFLVAAGALFIMLKRGVIPSWMELLKRNLPEGKPGKIFSYGSALSYFGGAILPIFFGIWMDANPSAWRLLFPLTSLFSLAGTLFLLRIPTPNAPLEKIPFNLKATLIRPWKNALHLFKTRPDFTRYQIGFMLGGGGLMIMQPALPAFFLGELKLSYTTLAIALAACKGIGFTLTSRLWASLLDRLNIFRFSSHVTVLAALFPLTLLLAKIHSSWVFAAYLTYGVMQAGSELSWHLSGPLFARTEDSSPYSSVNVVTVGLRGLIAPFCGAILCGTFSPTPVLLLGGALSLAAALQLRLAQRFAPSIRNT
ncbi:MAG: MFS transporter [Simkaniaceae bacterium]|nr:MFS transporter [Candidatus Sacchlamyda saccharinae]